MRFISNVKASDASSNSVNIGELILVFIEIKLTTWLFVLCLKKSILENRPAEKEPAKGEFTSVS